MKTYLFDYDLYGLRVVAVVTASSKEEAKKLFADKIAENRDLTKGEKADIIRMSEIISISLEESKVGYCDIR